jgi:hypothetical protein
MISVPVDVERTNGFVLGGGNGGNDARHRRNCNQQESDPSHDLKSLSENRPPRFTFELVGLEPLLMSRNLAWKKFRLFIRKAA